MKNERSEKPNVNVDRRHVIEKAGLFLGATGALVAIARPAAAQDNQGNGFPGATYLLTITDATSGNFASHSVITLHVDHSVALIDSGQEGGPVPFGSQLGVWATGPKGSVIARTVNFRFPFATQGSARVAL